MAATALLAASCTTYRLGEEAAVTSGRPAALPGDFLAEEGPVQAEAREAPASTESRTPAESAVIPDEERMASDRGVTSDEISLGVLTPATDSLEFAGVSYEGRQIEEVARPFIDEINAAGGINGRTLVGKFTRFNPVSMDNMMAACVAQSEDHKVFASLALLGFYGDAESCMADKETPTISTSGSSDLYLYERGRGWIRQTTMSKERSLRNWVDWIVESGTADASTRIGLYYTDVPEDRHVVNNMLLPYLERAGLSPAEIAVFTISSLDAMVAEAQRAAFKFRSSKIELVLPVTNFLQNYLFVQQADAIGYVPRYTVTDFGGMASDATGFYPPEHWQGTRGITSGLTGQPIRNGVPDTPPAQECLRVYNEAGLQIRPDPEDPDMPDGLEVAQMLTFCQHVALFADVARRAGSNPTRLSFLEALGNTGRWSHRVVSSPPLTFTPDKYDGADEFAVVQWQARCNKNRGCYRRVEPFRRGRW